MSWANLQTNGHMEVPTQIVKDPWELEKEDSLPSCSQSWSPAWRLPPSCPNMKNCLEIQVTLMEELGTIAPPSLSWKAPLVEVMLHDARTGLTKAVVTGPGRAALFDERHSMTADEARDATFLHTGAGMWVGKSAYPAADSMTIQEGKSPLLKP